MEDVPLHEARGQVGAVVVLQVSAVGLIALAALLVVVAEVLCVRKRGSKWDGRPLLGKIASENASPCTP